MTKKKKNGSTEQLTGIITPVQWEGDTISEVALCATDDETYRIENGDKFIDMVQQYIEATGYVRRVKKTFKTINIKKFRVVEI
jgi:hypothetical protein